MAILVKHFKYVKDYVGFLHRGLPDIVSEVGLEYRDTTTRVDNQDVSGVMVRLALGLGNEYVSDRYLAIYANVGVGCTFYDVTYEVAVDSYDRMDARYGIVGVIDDDVLAVMLKLLW